MASSADPYSAEQLAVHKPKPYWKKSASEIEKWKNQRRAMKKQLASHLEKAQKEPKHIKLMRQRKRMREAVQHDHPPTEPIPSWLRRSALMTKPAEVIKPKVDTYAGSTFGEGKACSATWKSSVDRLAEAKKPYNVPYHIGDHSKTKLGEQSPNYSYMFRSAAPRFGPGMTNKRTGARFPILKPSYIESRGVQDPASGLSPATAHNSNLTLSQQLRSPTRHKTENPAVVRDAISFRKPLGRFSSRRQREELYIYGDIMDGRGVEGGGGDGDGGRSVNGTGKRRQNPDQTPPREYNALEADEKHRRNIRIALSRAPRFKSSDSAIVQSGKTSVPSYAAPTLSDFAQPVSAQEAEIRRKRLDALPRFPNPELLLSNDTRFVQFKRSAQQSRGVLSTFSAREDTRQAKEAVRPSPVFLSPARPTLFERKEETTKELDAQQLCAATASSNFLASLGVGKKMVPLEMLESLRSPEQQVFLRTNGKIVRPSSRGGPML